MAITLNGTTGATFETGQRITGDFSNATVANRTAFQSSTTNGNTGMMVIPNGTATVANIIITNNSDTTNCAYTQIRADNTISGLVCGILGTGTYLPFTISTNATEQMRIATDGTLSFNSGYGSAGKAYGCRAWVNFNGTGTVAIRASGNVSSITDNGTADYTINFTTAMPDTNYHASGSMSATPGSAYAGSISLFTQGTTEVAPTTSAFRITTANGNNTLADPKYVCISVFR